MRAGWMKAFLAGKVWSADRLALACWRPAKLRYERNVFKDLKAFPHASKDTYSQLPIVDSSRTAKKARDLNSSVPSLEGWCWRWSVGPSRGDEHEGRASVSIGREPSTGPRVALYSTTDDRADRAGFKLQASGAYRHLAPAMGAGGRRAPLPKHALAFERNAFFWGCIGFVHATTHGRSCCCSRTDTLTATAIRQQ
ncbi:hypothetical protein BKA65DRAFT_474387 [Rhexocercosporidium sp. MPI-PUGE-AT-0058]|nr:hypothetical protein BKA65DRAFT_474387 [Rhexocercosporidium sp. MPI-PUGE-AT-0058]